MKAAWVTGAVGGALLSVTGLCPAVALACSVCFSAKNRDNQIAYLATTGFLTFLPLLLVGGLLLWIRKRAQALDRELPPLPPSEHPSLRAVKDERSGA